MTILPARLAYKKGYRAWLVWYLFGLFLWIFAMIVVVVIKDRTQPEATPAEATKPYVGNEARVKV